MKLHLPVRLFRAIVALMSLTPSVMYAAYVKPTEIVIPSSYTYVIEASSEDDVLQYMNDSSDIAFRLLDSLAFDSEAVMGSSAGKRLFSSNSSDSLTSITINGSRLYTVEFTALNEVEFSQCNGFTHSASILGGAISSKSEVLFNNNYKLTFVENTVQCQRVSAYGDSSTWAYGGAIYASEVEIVDNAIVDFSLNAATAVDFRTNSYGGAIYAASEIKINGNSSVLFYSNAVNSMRTSGGYSLDAFGGAICSSGSVFLEENESVKFTENYAYCPQSYSGAGDWDSLVAGGAIFGDSICIQKNKDVSFSLNAAKVNQTIFISACGSAIYATNDVILFDNESLEFTENKTIASYMDDNSGAVCAGQTIKLLKNRNARFENNSIIGCGMGAACAAGTIYISDNKEVGLTHNKIDALWWPPILGQQVDPP